MMYDTTGGGEKFRKCNGVTLAWWHTYKQALYIIWKSFANELFAPMWHYLYPGHAFYAKPSSLVAVISHLLWLNLTRSKYMPRLEKIMTDESMSKQMRILCEDLKFLLNVAIPVVCLKR